MIEQMCVLAVFMEKCFWSYCFIGINFTAMINFTYPKTEIKIMGNKSQE